MKPNEQRPTAYQITQGQVIMPRDFYVQNRDKLRGEFTCVAFGKTIEKRRLDQSYRVRIPFLKEHIVAGESVVVWLENGVLYVDRAST
jgi:hypothetical protein